MSISISAPIKKPNDNSQGNITSEAHEDTTAPSESNATEPKPNDTDLVDGMRKDFKDAMDSYEAFMDEYVAFMKKIQRQSERCQPTCRLYKVYEQVC